MAVAFEMNNDVILIWNSFSLKSLSSCQQHRHHHLTPLEHTDGVFGFNKTLELSGKGDHQKHFSRRRCKPPGHYTQVFPRLPLHTTNITRGIKGKRNKGFSPQESFALGIRPLVLEMRMVERKRIREGRRRASALNTTSCCSLYGGRISAFRIPILLKLFLPNFVALSSTRV